MRRSHVFVVIAATFLVASEALMATDPNQISQVASPTGQNQRLLRVHRTTVEDDAESEEQSLPMEEMKKMMKRLTTKEDFADKLGIATQIDDFIKKQKPGMVAFMQSTDYPKYIGYVNYLNDMAKIKNYNKKYVQTIKAKSLLQQ